MKIDVDPDFFKSITITDKEGEKEKFVIRECAICKLFLNEYDFAESNCDQLKDAEKWWNNEKLSIPCCNCFELLQFVTAFKERIFNYMNHRALYPKNLNAEEIKEIKRNTIKNLFNLNFISKDVKDDLLERWK